MLRRGWRTCCESRRTAVRRLPPGGALPPVLAHCFWPAVSVPALRRHLTVAGKVHASGVRFLARR